MADPSAFIALAREVIAKATPGPVGIWGEDDLPECDDLCIAAFDIAAPLIGEDPPSLYLCNIGSNGGERSYIAPVEAEEKWPVSLANARRLALGWNALPALLEVAEAAKALLWYHDRCRVESRYGDEMRKALAALAEVPQ